MKTVCFGEILLRLSPENHKRFLQAENFEAFYGGAEANVAVSLANFGADASFVTKLPAHEIGQAAVNCLRRFGVDTANIVRGGDRVGIYFCEKGASQRASKIIYDRAHTSIVGAEESDFDWDKIFDGANWFHFTGITPALGENLEKICLTACKKAKERGLTVSCDLNYRKKLWTIERAGKAMEKLLPFVDVGMIGIEDARDMFGIRSGDAAAGFTHEDYVRVARQLTERFGFRCVASTMRAGTNASDNDWAAMLFDGKKGYFSKTYSMRIVDRVGGGDSFCAGLIYALSEGFDAQRAVEFATAASCLKHTVEGDYNLVSVEEVESLVAGNGGGRVQR